MVNLYSISVPKSTVYNKHHLLSKFYVRYSEGVVIWFEIILDSNVLLKMTWLDLTRVCIWKWFDLTRITIFVDLTWPPPKMTWLDSSQFKMTLCHKPVIDTTWSNYRAVDFWTVCRNTPLLFSFLLQTVVLASEDGFFCFA